LKKTIEGFFVDKGEPEVHIMSLILSDDLNRARQLCRTDAFCWMIDTAADRLVIYENQVSDFYGWKTILEDFLAQLPCIQTRQQEVSEVESHTEVRRSRKLPLVTIVLVIVNVIVFLICTFTGDLLYNKGAFGVTDIIEDGAYYRMLTSMFLHADIEHLFSNMIVLYYIGEIVEKHLGHIPYAVLYFLSGMAGNVFSMMYELLTGSFFSSVGASGAVFGVEGALLFLVILHHGKLESMNAGRVAFSIAFSLYCGFTSTYVNNAAHVGGVLMGFAAAAVISLLSLHGGRRKDRDTYEN
jgi:rhomboid protease GluP